MFSLMHYHRSLFKFLILIEEEMSNDLVCGEGTECAKRYGRGFPRAHARFGRGKNHLMKEVHNNQNHAVNSAGQLEE